MAWQDNKEYVIRENGCETDNNGVIINVRVRELDEIFDATDAQITAAYNRDRWADIRLERNRLIAQSDYLALQDTSELSQDWIDYRQALRDITSSVSDPDDVVWPDKPA
jgi:hypothetical protein